jgi:hypothetical protein
VGALLKFWKLRINSRIKSARVDLEFDLEIRIRTSPKGLMRLVGITKGVLYLRGI